MEDTRSTRSSKSIEKNKTYMKSKRLNKQAKGLHEFAPSHLHINITASGLKFYGTPEYVNERFCDADASS